MDAANRRPDHDPMAIAQTATRDDQRVVWRTRDDEQLAAAVERAHEEPFAEIYQRLHRRVYAFCLSILADSTEAEDALQETMTSAYRELRAGRVPDRVRPWLFTIARNACMDRLRRESRIADGEPGEDQLTPVRSAHDVAVEREGMAELVADLATLSDAQRTALAMRELGGLGHGEIGDTLDASPAQAKALIAEARRCLDDRVVGRAMPCDQLRGEVRAKGRRALRGRRLRAHIDACPACRQYADETRAVRSLAGLAVLLPAARAAQIDAAATASGATAAGGGSLAWALALKKMVAVVAIAGAVGAGAYEAGVGSGNRDGVPAAVRPASAKAAAGDAEATAARGLGARDRSDGRGGSTGRQRDAAQSSRPRSDGPTGARSADAGTTAGSGNASSPPDAVTASAPVATADPLGTVDTVTGRALGTVSSTIGQTLNQTSSRARDLGNGARSAVRGVARPGAAAPLPAAPKLRAPQLRPPHLVAPGGG